MTYTLEPELPGESFQVRDVLPNEQPKRRLENQYEPHSSYDACIGVIGSADGPTVLFVSSDKASEKHSVLSALHFEVTEDVEWKTVFYEKLTEDVETVLSEK